MNMALTFANIEVFLVVLLSGVCVGVGFQPPPPLFVGTGVGVVGAGVCCVPET